MNRLVLDLLDLARFDEGAMHARKAWVDLVPVLEDVRERLLRRLAENLLDNAMKFSPSDQPVEVELREADDTIELSVLDRGRTIPVEDRERIFARWQGEPATHSRGLGLSFCRMAAEVHGGRIEAVARPAGGNILRVSLPSR